MSHTPGPWKYCKQPHPRVEHLTGFAIYGGDGTIADIFPEPYPVHVSEANARLIAAAPELLTTCKHLLWLIESQLHADGGHIAKDAHAVIAKAKGIPNAA